MIRKVVTQKRHRVRSTGQPPSGLPIRLTGRRERQASLNRTDLDNALPTPESSEMSNSGLMTSSASKRKQKVDAIPTDNPDYRHLLQFRVEDDEAFEKFCEATFNELQQLAMKTILKAWIKELEPKKQKNYPYCQTSKTGRSPEWWPRETVRHKEPDHLSKEGMCKVWFGGILSSGH